MRFPAPILSEADNNFTGLEFPAPVLSVKRSQSEFGRDRTTSRLSVPDHRRASSLSQVVPPNEVPFIKHPYSPR